MQRTLYWKKGVLYILHQKLLPDRIVYLPCRTSEQVARCIKDMVIRGAPAIGIAAAYGLVLAVKNKRNDRAIHTSFYRAKSYIASTRPTGVNLFWALNEMDRVFQSIQNPVRDAERILRNAAHRVLADDIAANKKMGEYGAQLLKKNSVVLTHCNAGALATGGWGTALGIIRTGFKLGKIQKVYVDETRPYLQGARLTAWELQSDHIPVVLITDNMAGHIMKTEQVNAVIVGADRIASNGDVANKIGTYSVAVLAAYHRIPFYVAAPISTFDRRIASGADITIEERPTDEVTRIGSQRIAPRGILARHPAFDVTPASLITAIITERGIIHKPSLRTLKNFFS